MTPDPFRPLDHIDPPDQWADVTRRAGADDDVVVDVSPVRPARRRALAVAAVAAAALLVALAAGTVVATGDDDDGVSTVATDPHAPVVDPVVPGPCPFGLDPAADLPPLEPGRKPVEDVGVSPPETGATWGHLAVDGLPIEVVVAGTDAEPSMRDDQGVAVDLFAEEDRRVTVVGWELVADEGPCNSVHVFAHVPLRVDDPVVAEAAASGTPPSEAELEPYVDIARPTIERVRDAVVVGQTTEPGDGGPCRDVEPDPAIAGAATRSSSLIAGELGDGRAFTVMVDNAAGTVTVTIDGEGPSGGTAPDGPGDQGWSLTGDGRGLLVGWLPPGTVALFATAPDGSRVSDGLAVSPVDPIFALPEVGQAPGPDGEAETWPVTFCTANGTEVDLAHAEQRQADLDAQSDDLTRQLMEEAQRYQDCLAVAAGAGTDPAACGSDPRSEPTTTEAATGPDTDDLSGTPCPFRLETIDGAGRIVALDGPPRPPVAIDQGQPATWARLEVDGRTVIVGLGAPRRGSSLDGAEVGDFSASIDDVTGRTASGSALVAASGPCSAAEVRVEGFDGDGLTVTDLGSQVLAAVRPI